jgi:hypothetical protein
MLLMDTTIHSHIAGLHIQGRIAEASAVRQTREARAPRRPRPARRHFWQRASKPRTGVAINRAV